MTSSSAFLLENSLKLEKVERLNNNNNENVNHLCPQTSMDANVTFQAASPAFDSPQLNSTLVAEENLGSKVEPGKKAHFMIGSSVKRSKGNNNGQISSMGGPDGDKSGTNVFPSPILSRSKEENYEGFADGSESFLFDSAQENTSLQYSRDPNDWSALSTGSTSSLPFRRNSILRSSLRKSPQNNNNGDGMGLHRRVGSFRSTSGTKRPQVITPVNSSALTASHLYRTSSFNSSGRSSAGDVEEMYSDGSLEDEVIDLTQKYHHLEEKFSVLAENQSTVDDRYARAKQENVELSTKLFMVEEQMRDVEQRGEERLREEQRRYKEALARLEREKELQLANYEIRLQATQKELEGVKAEGTRLKSQIDRERTETSNLNERLNETERHVVVLRDDNRRLLEDTRADRDALTLETIGSQQALLDLKREFEGLRKYQMQKGSSGVAHHRESIDGDINELYSRLAELEEENKRVKNENRELNESNDDLTAQMLSHRLEEGRQLLTMNHINGMGNSLAAEFEAMSQEQMKSALKEQKEVNDQLRTYIDTILLSIVENYPQLLEVKNKCQSSNKSQLQSQFES